MVQRELCEKYIGAHLIEGWVVLAERFDDEGVSGATVERPALARLFRRVEAGEVDRVVTYRLDRITRSLVDWANLLAIFRQHDVRLSLTCGELGESEVATSDFILNMLAAFAEFERGMIRDRLRDGKAARKRRGLRTGGLVPFGFRANASTRQLEQVPEEADLVRHIFERAAAGSTPAEIASWLAESGAATKRTGKVGGRPWTARAVLRVLGNRAYVGEIGGVSAKHGTLVSEDMFKQAHKAVATRRTRAPGRRPAEEKDDPFLLRGLLRCARCDRLMTTASGKRRGKRPPATRYYRCRGASACRGTQVSAVEIERRVVKWLRDPPPRRLSPDAPLVLAELDHMWPVLFPRSVRSLVEQLVWEVRWDASRNRVTIMLDEIAVHEFAERIRRLDAHAAPVATE